MICPYFAGLDEFYGTRTISRRAFRCGRFVADDSPDGQFVVGQVVARTISRRTISRGQFVT